MADPERQAGDLVPGELFAERYQVEAVLGRGGMGTVYRVRDFELGEPCALKVLSLRPEPPPVAILRFREEVRLARRVTHPNVARVYDIGEHREHIFLTMELVDGDTLRSVLRAEGRLAPERAVAIARTLCEGLEAAHAVGVVHRDLKPANILVDRRGRVVITDFGIARSLLDHADLTVGAIGTPRYMAPEQASSKAVDARTDLYSLGLVLWEMLAGEPPEGGLEVMSAKLAAVASPSLAAVVLRCLASEKEARPASALEVARLLAAADTPAPALAATLPVGLPALGDTPTVDGATRNATISEPTGARVVAVLPFQYRGPKDHDYFGDACADVLVDALSCSRGLRVLGSAAASKVCGARPPREVGAELGAYAVVHGTVQVVMGRVRITLQLVDVASGAPLLRDRHEGAITAFFEMQESIARRVAEQLRVDLTLLTHSPSAPREAIEQYLATRWRDGGAPYPALVEAAVGLERCLELAPSFPPALAAHAIVCVRCWFWSFGPIQDRDWEKASEASVARALAEAPDLAETHLAAGIHTAQYGRYGTAVRSVAHALSIAPTHPYALEYLGMLQCEAGQWDEGEARLRVAGEIDATLSLPLVFLARQYELRGRRDQADATLAELERRHGVSSRPLIVARARLAAWRGDAEALRRLLAVHQKTSEPSWSFLRAYMLTALHEVDDAEATRLISTALVGEQSPRRVATLAQLAAEALAAGGALASAWKIFERAAQSALADLAWVDHCPLLAPLRQLPGFAAARALVRARADEISGSTPT